jgi:hypothetical protein
MDSVVNPATTLLHAQTTPLAFREETTLGRIFCDVLRKNDVTATHVRAYGSAQKVAAVLLTRQGSEANPPVLKVVVIVLFGVLDVL